jgi:hypothetical protein
MANLKTHFRFFEVRVVEEMREQGEKREKILPCPPSLFFF